MKFADGGSVERRFSRPHGEALDQAPDFHARLIVTAASESYSRQLMALLGSLRCNWPEHPPVMVYDLGLTVETLAILDRAGIAVRKIPPFVTHWRKHYTWKPWCLNDAPAERVLWLDSGLCVLRPLDEIFDIIGAQGYFSVPNYQPLNVEASLDACEGCAVEPEFRNQKSAVAANVFGYARGTKAADVVEQWLSVSLTERFIMATDPRHRHDQAILSLLLYRDIHPLILCDGQIYCFEDLGAKFTTHAIWAVRRGMHYKDIKFYAQSLLGPAASHRPRPSHKLSWWYRVAWQIKLLLDSVQRVAKNKPAPDGVKP